MKIRNGFVSNSSSSSFVLRIENDEGMKQLWKMFEDTLEWDGDNTHIVIGHQDAIMDMRMNHERKKQEKWNKNQPVSGFRFWPDDFVYHCSELTKYEKLYGASLVIINISDWDIRRLQQIKKCKNITIVKECER